MNRTCIFCYYNRNGRITEDVPWLLSELKKIANFVIVVVNGNLISKDVFEQMADKVVIRKNEGYDAGAYKRVLLDLECRDIVENSEELVFCNNTFWGPFVSLEDIFDIMRKKDADFWGMGIVDNGLRKFIPSYFLVFRKRILRDEVLIKYFKESINDNYGYYDVCYYFEVGLFSHLIAYDYKYDTYLKINYNPIANPDASICCDKWPILKKKVFSEQHYNRKKILNALKYINNYYDYNIEIILNTAKELYGSELTIQDVKNHVLSIEKPQKIVKVDKGLKKILDFVEDHSQVFMYGTGVYADYLRRVIDADKILGYIVSDDQKIENRTFENKPVYKLSELSYKKDVPILIALGVQNTQQVINNLIDYKNVFSLWNVD